MGSDLAYSPALARHYDRDYGILRRDAADVAWYRELALAADGPVLEVACGTGRVLLPIAEAGVEVVGADPTPEMLGEFAAKLQGRPAAVRARVTLLKGHFGEVPHAGGFALVFSAFRAFQHLLDVDAQRAGLAELARLTAPGGRVAFDVFDYDPRLARRFGRELVDYRMEADGVRHERRSSGRLDPDTGLLEARLRWLRDDEQTDATSFRMRISTRDELVGLVEEAGLELESVHADFLGSPWTPDDPREIVLLARRPDAP